jgi:hypothetical protein
MMSAHTTAAVLVLVLVLVVEIILLKQTRSLTSLHLGNAGEDSRKPLANFQSTRRSAQKKDVGSA